MATEKTADGKTADVPDVRRASIEAVEALISPDFASKTRAQVTAEKNEALEKQFQDGSQQIELQPSGFSVGGFAGDVIQPPIDLKLWATQLSRSTRLNRAVRTIARNTVGLGWEIVPRVPFKDDTKPEEKDAFEAEAERVRNFLDDANPEQPFESLMECTSMDEEATGNGYLEFTETGTGALDKIFHVPSITIRILAAGRGYVQIRRGERKFFKKFEEERVMDARNGKFQDEKGFAAVESSQSDGPAVLPTEHKATRLLHFKLYHPMSEVYGLPKFIAAGAAIAGNWHASRRNVVFFVNDAVPRMAVLVSGGKLDEESLETIQKYFQDGMGSDEAHRMMVLQSTTEGVGVDDKNTTKLDLKPLTVGVTEDGSFLNYRVANDEEIREAMGLSEVYFKSIKLTKASAVVAKATTDEQEFAPARKAKEFLLNKRVIWGALGATTVRLKFNSPETTDPLEQAQVNKIYSDIGAVTSNEVRNDLGRDPLPASEEWANIPMSVALLGLKGEILQGSSMEMEQPQQVATPPSAANEPPSDDDEGDGEGDGEGDDEGAEKTIPDNLNGAPVTTRELPFVKNAVNRLTTLPERLESGKT